MDSIGDSLTPPAGSIVKIIQEEHYKEVDDHWVANNPSLANHFFKPPYPEISYKPLGYSTATYANSQQTKISNKNTEETDAPVDK